jgi:indolepyruvate ferredoxin oxidoreductase alpha subunit
MSRITLRTTTRISHGKSVVYAGEWERGEKYPDTGLVKDPAKFVMVPANARIRHLDLEERISSLKDFAESCSFNRVEMADKELGVVTSGISYNYVKEALPDASVLKLGLVFPLPDKLIRDFASRCRRIIVVEELEPYLEEGLRYLGIEAEGKSLISRFGEIDTGTVRRAVTGVGEPAEARHEPLDSIPVRPPVMCIGCPHRGIFHLLSRKGIFVAGDIGCYTLAVSPPLSAIHTTVCMGAGVNQAAGIEAVLPEEHGKVVAVIGDSTFLHSGLGGILNMAYNEIPATILILDNFTTAMTGRQNHPGSGFDITGNRTRQVDWDTASQGIGDGACTARRRLRSRGDGFHLGRRDKEGCSVGHCCTGSMHASAKPTCKTGESLSDKRRDVHQLRDLCAPTAGSVSNSDVLLSPEGTCPSTRNRLLTHRHAQAAACVFRGANSAP